MSNINVHILWLCHSGNYTRIAFFVQFLVYVSWVSVTNDFYYYKKLLLLPAACYSSPSVVIEFTINWEHGPISKQSPSYPSGVWWHCCKRPTAVINCKLLVKIWRMKFDTVIWVTVLYAVTFDSHWTVDKYDEITVFPRRKEKNKSIACVINGSHSS